jgi:hypothetical protein
MATSFRFLLNYVPINVRISAIDIISIFGLEGGLRDRNMLPYFGIIKTVLCTTECNKYTCLSYLVSLYDPHYCVLLTS